jgi:L,D-peptidoglycan transpeptidase YkuD (ErfK/YbiS/YcfS/YnhG family)
MPLGRILSSAAAVAAVAACAALAVGMSHAVTGSSAAPQPSDSTATSPSDAALPGYVPVSAPVGSGSATLTPHQSPSLTPTGSPSSAVANRPRIALSSAVRPKATVAAIPSSPGPSSPTPGQARAPAPAPSPLRGSALPVAGSTAGATRVITVLASSYGSTTATLQAWNRAPGGGWLRYGSPVLAHVGADGLSTAPSESRSATPIGSFTLTQAFGRYANPGTALPYLQTNPSDWWISQYGGSYAGCYNTLQTAAPSRGCPYNQGGPNEQLSATSLYDYAVVIDYNTRNSPGGVVQAAGSAFFLHVTDGTPTAGCVAIPMSNLVTIMRWLTPAAHPRILIGVA